MKLQLNAEAINLAIAPQKFNIIDVLGILPRLTVGNFKGCVITLTYDKILVVTEGLILVYKSLNDFMNGYEPLSLVKDESIHYDQETPNLELKITEEQIEIKNEDFAPIRELMFGAREANAPIIEVIDSNDNSLQIES